MKKPFLLFLISLISLSLYSQNHLYQGYIIFENQDTLFGQLPNKNYFNKRKVSIIVQGQKENYKRKQLKSIHYSNKTYVKGQTEKTGASFYLKTQVGGLNLYQKRKRKYIGQIDTQISSGGLLPSIKYYCSDFPDIQKYQQSINDSTIEGFLMTYHQWKQDNKESQSYYEQHKDQRGGFHFKMSFILPGIGVELRLNDEFSLAAMIKGEPVFHSGGIKLNPMFDNQLRYYFDTKSRKRKQKRIHKYTGYYLGAKVNYDIQEQNWLIGPILGWQYVINKNYYSNFSLGGGIPFPKDGFPIMINLEIGLML